MTEFTCTLADGREAVVRGEYVPATFGFRNSLGVPEEPDEPSDFEIDSVTVNGEEVKVSNEEYSAIVDHILAELIPHPPRFDYDPREDDGDPDYDCGPML